MKVLHVVPDSAVAPSHRYLGSTKDIRGRTEYLQSAGIDYEEIAVVRRDEALLAKLQSLPIDRLDAVLIELALYPRSMRWLRRRAPGVRQLLRPTNAAALQQLHLARLAVSLAPRAAAGVRQGAVEVLRGLRRFQQERACARIADHVLAITEWERTQYWQRLTSPGSVVTVPYFVPRGYDSGEGPGEKRDDCVCLTSSSVSPFLLDAARTFERLVERLGDRCREWRFMTTGELPAGMALPPARVIRAGFVGDLSELLGRARAIALLSDYGFGFKTKVLDAVRFKCFMLVTGAIYGRMPVEARPFCVVVDPASADSFAGALERCRQPYPDARPNEQFRDQAFHALDSLLGRR